ncbi:hypothetical protein NL676_007406 [Syzygium grande]|nr:hypothetical protein NL676_007406 [Syzygium grande]
MHHLSEHPNVVQIEGTYEDAMFVHIVMELCAGGELFDRIIQKGHFSEREAAELIKTIVGVVKACHSLGVRHRDLKPENFLFDSPDDDAKLKATDFGLSIFYKPGGFSVHRGCGVGLWYRLTCRSLPENFDGDGAWQLWDDKVKVMAA